MNLDNGIATIRRGFHRSSPSGGMPKAHYKDIFQTCYGCKTVGFNRYYAALSHDDRIDLLIEIQRNGGITTADICCLDSITDSGESGTYKILQVQHIEDEDGNPVTDLSLERIKGIDS